MINIKVGAAAAAGATGAGATGLVGAGYMTSGAVSAGMKMIFCIVLTFIITTYSRIWTAVDDFWWNNFVPFQVKARENVVFVCTMWE